MTTYPHDAVLLRQLVSHVSGAGSLKHNSAVHTYKPCCFIAVVAL